MTREVVNACVFDLPNGLPGILVDVPGRLAILALFLLAYD